MLAAAISAFTPKYRPTPLLTPLFAGIFAAIIATAAIYAVHTVAPKRAAVAAAVQTMPAARAPAQTVKTTPVMEQASPEPDLAATPKRSDMQALFDSGDFTAAPKNADQVQATVQPPPAKAADSAANSGPLADMANAVVPPAHAAEAPAAGEPAKKPVVAVARVPLPAAAPPTAEPPPDPNPTLNLAARFDPSGPVQEPADGPPIILDTPTGAAKAHGSIPPLPRIRPCGAGGPACP